MKTRKRTLGRQIAVQLLYQYDIRRKIDKKGPEGGLPDMDVEGFIAQEAEDLEVREFALKLFHGAVESLRTTDQLISEVVDNWKIERIAAMDRAILRLAIFELNELMEVPAKVVINEAIELAKKFSTAQSGAFVNGILNRLLILRNPPSMDSHV
ncbi:MAG: transcription antitermination factor NusB [Planctomycetes bacterium]|nr:transcription antitermination factor NusB [Planctomycetota bacterium]